MSYTPRKAVEYFRNLYERTTHAIQDLIPTGLENLAFAGVPTDSLGTETQRPDPRVLDSCMFSRDYNLSEIRRGEGGIVLAKRDDGRLVSFDPTHVKTDPASYVRAKLSNNAVKPRNKLVKKILRLFPERLIKH